jgi:Carboxypeptidase regulatory-like domain
MKTYTKVAAFLLMLMCVMILPWSQTQAEGKHEHKPSDSALVRSNIVGKVVDAQGNPIEKVKVTVLDPDNREVVARGVTNKQGEYVIECLDPRQYYLALSALPERFVGQTVVVNLGKDGQIVQWAANAEVPAVATTRIGGGENGLPEQYRWQSGRCPRQPY